MSGYPQQGGFPPAGGQYPPQQGGYPPQQGGQYPPQQGGQYPPQQGQYPPQQAGQYPPQQGGQYPPQQGGQYPPQQGGYPPQQGGYPPQQGGHYPPQQGGQYPPQPKHGQYPPQQGGQYPPQQGGFPPAGGQYPPQQGGQYPPQQGGQYPPQQGGQYPPQQGGQYPPQQGGQYPPQQGGFPPAGGQYPPQQGGQYPPQQGGQYPNMTQQMGNMNIAGHDQKQQQGYSKRVYVGPSQGNNKLVQCPGVAFVLNKPQNRQEAGWAEKYDVKVGRDSFTVIRTDQNCGWGQPLELIAFIGRSEEIRVGKSDANKKTVRWPGCLYVDPTPANPQGQGAHDEFRVTMGNDSFTVERVDVDQGWGQDLRLRGIRGVHGQDVSYSAANVSSAGEERKAKATVVKIGKSDHNHKKIRFNNVIFVDSKPVNQQGNGWSDRFQAVVTGPNEFTVSRLDHDGGWGQELELRAYNSYDEVHVGTSETNVKTVGCEDVLWVGNNPLNPQQPGWNNRFQATVGKDEFTVQRLDHPGGWGQNLKLPVIKR